MFQTWTLDYQYNRHTIISILFIYWRKIYTCCLFLNILFIRRVFHLLASGFLLPSSTGLIDPCEQGNLRLHSLMSLVEQVSICVCMCACKSFTLLFYYYLIKVKIIEISWKKIIKEIEERERAVHYYLFLFCSNLKSMYQQQQQQQQPHSGTTKWISEDDLYGFLKNCHSTLLRIVDT